MISGPKSNGDYEKTVVSFDAGPVVDYSLLWRPEVPVVIDGNNLLYAARAVETAGPLMGRSLLCGTLSQWASRRGERVHVVFDGPSPGRARATQIGDSDIEVSFSGGVSADAALIGMIEADSAARRLLVVSSDREIVRAAKRRRAQAIRSDEFWALVRQDLARALPAPTEPAEKRHGLDPEGTNQWLREFGLDQPDENAG
jgi:hypothetical protein